MVTTIPSEYQWIKGGEKVNYHSIIGGEVTTPGLEVKAGPQELGEGSGNWVVWLTEKSGAVSCDVVSPYKKS